MKNFNELSKGEKAFRLDNAVRALASESDEFYSLWLSNYDDGDDTVEKAKMTWDDVDDDDEDGLWEGLVEAFQYMVERYGSEEGKSLRKCCRDGLWIRNYSMVDYEEDEVGGGFLVRDLGPQSDAQVAEIRDTLEAMGYPLTPSVKKDRFTYFQIDWKEVRAKAATDFIKESVEWLQDQDCGCCTIRLTAATQLAVGWENGFDPKDPSIIHSKTEPTWGICVGIKALEGDDLKTDFEWLTTPYVADGDNEGEVFSNLEMPLSPKEDYEQVFKYLIGEYENLLKDYKVRKDGKCLHR